uniref:FMN hydroxy acid dehydrogenase domain-containing protein n=1 Tax=Rhabditophanes sp. KR3021 TaxID=114890 RepID=A0AC35UIQ1_9BILA
MLNDLVCIDDLEKRAYKLLPKSARDYYLSGSDSEETLRRNIYAFKKFLVRPFCLRNVSSVDLSTSFNLGKETMTFPCPIGLAPTAFHKLASGDGEISTVRAASKANLPMICSTLGTVSATDIAKQSFPNTILWFQLYIFKDREVTKKLIKKVKAAGFKALVLTVDTPVFAKRRTEARNNFQLPSHLELANFKGEESEMEQAKTGQSGLQFYSQNYFDASLTWDDLRWLIEYSQMPVIVKGILRSDDAELAIKSGASAIYVSNHGGRQMNSAISTIEALAGIVEEVRKSDKHIPIFFDSGVRTGLDILKAVVLGADLVLVGRPVLYGLTCGGEAGVTHALNILKSEFEVAMKLAGVTSIAEARASKQLLIKEDIVSKI